MKLSLTCQLRLSILPGTLLTVLCACAPSAPDVPAPNVPAPPAPREIAGGLDAEALATLEKATSAVKDSLSDAASWAALGRAYESSQVHGGAETAFSTAASLAAEDPKLWYRAAINAGRAGETQRAIQHLDRVHKLDPSYGPAWRRLGTLQLDLGQPDQARVAFTTAAKLMPEVADAEVGLARAALASDDIAGALRHARVAFERAPTDPYVRLILGNALRRSDKADEALPHLKAGQGATPRYVDPWSEDASRARRQDEDLSNRANRLVQEKQWDGAIEALRELRDLRPKDVRVALRLGVALLGGGQTSEAEAHYDEIFAEFPGSYDIATSRAAALRESGKLARSLSASDKVIQRWPDRAPGYLQRGSTLGAMGDIEGARSAFQRASQLSPSDLRGPLFEGRLLAQARRFPEAVAILQKGLDLPGASPPLVYFKMLITSQAMARMGDKAMEETLRRARSLHGDAADTLLQRR